MAGATRFCTGPFGSFSHAVGGRVAGLLDLGEHVLHQLLEVVGARHEVRLAVHLDEHAASSDPATRVLPISPSLVARPAFFAALARPRLRRMVFASSKSPFASVERRLALHHARAGLVAELLHLCCGNRVAMSRVSGTKQ